ncbi:MAG: hypothetical protein ACOCXQ_03505 [Patescibacteria group bacterium]
MSTPASHTSIRKNETQQQPEVHRLHRLRVRLWIFAILTMLFVAYAIYIITSWYR